MPESISTAFAFKVRDLNRLGLSVAAIARSMGVDEAAVMGSHRLLYLPVNDSDASVTVRTNDQRAAEIDRLPKKMQDRIRKART